MKKGIFLIIGLILLVILISNSSTAPATTPQDTFKDFNITNKGDYYTIKKDGFIAEINTKELINLKSATDMRYENNIFKLKTIVINSGTLYFPYKLSGIKTAPKIYSCLDKNFNGTYCSNWKKENITYVYDGSYIYFNISHLTAYTVGASSNFSKLEQCLFFVNGTTDTCVIESSNIQETFGNYIWWGNSSGYSTNGLVLALGLEDGIDKFTKRIEDNLFIGSVALGGLGIQQGYGITTNGSDFWIVDNSKDFVFHLNRSFDNQTDGFSTAIAGDGTPQGITTNGSDFWIMDSADQFVYHYNSSGDNVTLGNKGTGVGFSVPIFDDMKGITTNGSDFWIVGWRNDFVYHYNSSGDNQTDGFSIYPQVLFGTDITTNGSDLWIADRNTRAGGNFISHFDKAGNNLTGGFFMNNGTQFEGLTTNFLIKTKGSPTDFWFLDDFEDFLHHYDNSFTDYSGDNYHASCSGTRCPTKVINDKSTILGSASYFNQSQYINSTNFKWDANQSVTVAFWVKTSASADNDGSLFSIGDGLDENRFQAHLPYDNILYWDYGDYTVNGRVSVDFTSYLDKWTHVVLESNGTDWSAIYINGNLAASSILADTPDKNLTGALIGGASLVGTWYYNNATIDEFVIYNRTLNSTEIQQLAWGSQNRYDSNTTSDTFISTATNLGNISIDFNGTSLFGSGGTSTGINLVGGAFSQNITFKNVYVNGFYDNVLASGYNVTLLNVTSINSVRDGFTLGSTALSQNITLQDSKCLYTGRYSVLIDANGDYTTISNINVSHGVNSLLGTNAGTSNVIVKDSWFDNSSTSGGISLIGDNSKIINNTIKNIMAGTGVALGIGAYGTIENNNLINNNMDLYVSKKSNLRIINNLFNTSSEDNFLGSTAGANIWLDGITDSIIENNTIENSVGVGIALTDFASSVNVNNISISGNTFKNTTADACVLGTCWNDLWILEASGDNIDNVSIWKNHFYTLAPTTSLLNVGLVNDIKYCVENEGNFYNENITDYNETDCGISNFTFPINGDTINGIYNFSWKHQSAIKGVNYSLYLKLLDGTWEILDSNINNLNYYNFNTTEYPNGVYSLKLRPFDDYTRATNTTIVFSLLNIPPTPPGGGGGGVTEPTPIIKLEEGFNFTIYNEKNITSLKGKTLYKSLIVRNFNNNTLLINLKCIYRGIKNNPCQWIEFAENNFTINGSKSKKINYNIRIPDNVDNFDYYYFIFRAENYEGSFYESYATIRILSWWEYFKSNLNYPRIMEIIKEKYLSIPRIVYIALIPLLSLFIFFIKRIKEKRWLQVILFSLGYIFLFILLLFLALGGIF